MLNDFISTFTRMVPYHYVGESLPCNLCGGNEREVVGRRDRYGNKLTTALCLNCGLVFTDPMPTEQEVATYYTRFYRRHYQHVDKPSRKLLLRSIRNAQMNYEHVEPYLSPGDKIVDVGSGAGELVRNLRERGYDAQGIEPNQGFAQYSVQTYQIPVLQASWAAAEIPPASLNLVTAYHVLEHLHDPLAHPARGGVGGLARQHRVPADEPAGLVQREREAEPGLERAVGVVDVVAVVAVALLHPQRGKSLEADRLEVV